MQPLSDQRHCLTSTYPAFVSALRDVRGCPVEVLADLPACKLGRAKAEKVGSAAKLADVIAKARLDISRLVKTALHKLFDPRLSRGPCECGHE